MSILQQGHKKASKLTLESVREIRRLYGEGYTQGSIAKYAGVTIGTIGRIVRGETWCEGAGDRAPTALEIKTSEQRMVALAQQIERENAPGMRQDVPAVPVAAPRVELPVSEEARARANVYLGYGETPKRASPPPSLLDGGDAPTEATGEGLAKLEEVAQEEGLDVEIALKRGAI